MTRLLAPATLLALLLAPCAAAQETPDRATIVVERGEAPRFQGPDGEARTTVVVDGARYAWELDLPGNYTVVTLLLYGAWDVDRPAQLVPELDDGPMHPGADHLHPHFFTPVRYDPAEADGAARVVNATRTGDGFRIDVGVPGPGAANLTLRRDVAPPIFALGEPRNVSTIGFLLTTTTDEFAYADLRIAPAAGGEEVPNPTAVPALEQTFPVQGLDADALYRARVRFWDWSGNEAWSPAFTVRTAPEPARPVATFLELAPPANATVAAVPSVGATFASPDSPVRRDGVRLFVDKTEVTTGVAVLAAPLDGGAQQVRWTPPEPLAPGRHSASVEVRNEAGGLAVARWTFEIAREDAPAGGLGLFVAGLLLAALRARRAR